MAREGGVEPSCDARCGPARPEHPLGQKIHAADRRSFDALPNARTSNLPHRSLRCVPPSNVPQLLGRNYDDPLATPFFLCDQFRPPVRSRTARGTIPRFFPFRVTNCRRQPARQWNKIGSRNRPCVIAIRVKKQARSDNFSEHRWHCVPDKPVLIIPIADELPVRRERLDRGTFTRAKPSQTVMWITQPVLLCTCRYRPCCSCRIGDECSLLVSPVTSGSRRLLLAVCQDWTISGQYCKPCAAFPQGNRTSDLRDEFLQEWVVPCGAAKFGSEGSLGCVVAHDVKGHVP